MEQVRLLKGDNMELLKTLETNSIDSVVSDPPYGLSFMNKKWDYDVPSVELWKEVLRVLKPGGHVLSFGGTRTYHRMVINMEDAGFEIRDSISYMYGSGFPKSHNIGNSIDKKHGASNRGHAISSGSKIHPTTGKPRANGEKLDKYQARTDEGKGWEGWGTALKPSMELICLARKPLTEKSIAENVLKHGTGGINIDDCRVEATDQDVLDAAVKRMSGNDAVGWKNTSQTIQPNSNEGRFPANTILECICDEVIPGENKGLKKETFENYGNGELGKKDGRKTQPTPKEIEGTWYKDTGDIHTNPECPCYILDKQSGVKQSTRSKRGGAIDNNEGRYNWNNGDNNKIEKYECGFDDKGGASRFFYTAKVSKKERNMGLDEFEEKERPGQSDKGLYSSSPYCIDCGKTINGTNDHSNCKEGLEYKPSTKITKNHHPTVKPVNLMTYLCRLITPPNGVILDMYMGSGSTGISALLEGFNFIGMEMDEDYFKIAEARINNYEQYRQFKK